MDGAEVHYVSTKGVEIKKPTKNWVLHLPAGLTPEEYTKIIDEFLKQFEDEKK